MNGEEGYKKTIERAKTKGASYDVLLLDLQMPIMDGYDCASLINRDFGCCNLPVKNSLCIRHLPHAETPPDVWYAHIIAQYGSVASICGPKDRTPYASPLPTKKRLSGDSSQSVTSSPLGSRPVLIALTANTTEEDKLHCIKVGFDGFVAKPISLADVVQPLKVWGKKINQSRAKEKMKQLLAAAEDDTPAQQIARPHSAASLRELGQYDHHVASINSAAVNPTVNNLVAPHPQDHPPQVIRSNSAMSFNQPVLRAMASLDSLRTIDAAATSSSSSSPKTPSGAHHGATVGMQNLALGPRYSVDFSEMHSLGMPPMSPRVPLHPSSLGTRNTPSQSSRVLSRQLHSSRVVASQSSPILHARTSIASISVPLSLGQSAVGRDGSAIALESIYSHGSNTTHAAPPTNGPTATRVHVSPPMPLPRATLTAQTHLAAAAAHSSAPPSPLARPQQPTIPVDHATLSPPLLPATYAPVLPHGNDSLHPPPSEPA